MKFVLGLINLDNILIRILRRPLSHIYSHEEKPPRSPRMEIVIDILSKNVTVNHLLRRLYIIEIERGREEMDKFKHILIEYVVPLIAGLIGTLITLAVIKLKNGL